MKINKEYFTQKEYRFLIEATNELKSEWCGTGVWEREGEPHHDKVLAKLKRKLKVKKYQSGFYT